MAQIGRVVRARKEPGAGEWIGTEDRKNMPISVIGEMRVGMKNGGQRHYGASFIDASIRGGRPSTTIKKGDITSRRKGE